MGGKITRNSIEAFSRHDLGEAIDQVETRRFILDFRSLRDFPEQLDKFLRAEEALTSYDLQRQTRELSLESTRLADLRARIGHD